MPRITELIVGTKPATGRGTGNIIVMTESGKEVWVPTNQFKEDAETITYEPYGAGDTFVAQKDSSRVHPAGHAQAGQPLYTKGSTVVRTKAGANFIAVATKQVVKRVNALDILAYMAEKGMSNAISLAGI